MWCHAASSMGDDKEMGRQTMKMDVSDQSENQRSECEREGDVSGL